MNFLSLSNNTKMPLIGLGTWKTPKDTAKQIVKEAVLNLNYRHIDCAERYGNEPEIGQVFTEIYQESNLKRSDLFITSKVWNNHHKADQVVAACKNSLKNLKTDYLDLYLIHWNIATQDEENLTDKNGMIIPTYVPLQETWQAMETLVKEGLVKTIGVSNFSVTAILDILSYAKIKPSINQIELHPYNPQTQLVKFCQYHNIQITAYSPLGSSNQLEINQPKLLQDQTIIDLAKKYNKSVPQIILRHTTQKNIAVIPRSFNPEHLKSNTEIFDFELTPEEMETLENLPTRHRYVDPSPRWGLPYFG